MSEHDQFEYVPDAPPMPRPPSAPAVKAKTSGLAITAFVLSMLFIVPLLPIIGTILGIVSVATIKPHQGGRGLAIAAIPVGLVVVFFVQGIMAAVAIPAFIDYVRKSKASEVQANLDICYRGVVDYLERPHNTPGGMVATGLLPESTAMACPNGVSDPKDLTDKPGLVRFPAGSREAFAKLGWAFNDPVYGCYRYRSDAAGTKPADGAVIVCEAWTDLDDDDQPAHWTLRATYDARHEVFGRDRPVVRPDEDSDDW